MVQYPIITSRANSRVAQIRGLRRRSERDRTGLYLAEGIRIVTEAVAVAAPIVELVVAPELVRSEVAMLAIDKAESAGVQVLRLSADAFQSISGKENPAGLAAVVEQRWAKLEAVDPATGLCWVVLAEAQDPGNVGTVLRTADAVGAAGVILLGKTADPFDPVAIRAGMGAVFSVPVIRAELDALSAWKRSGRWRFVGASDSATMGYRDPSAYGAGPLAIVMGSEQHGLSNEQMALCDEVVSIPMLGRGDSLNLAVATGIVLYEVLANRAEANRRA